MKLRYALAGVVLAVGAVASAGSGGSTVSNSTVATTATTAGSSGGSTTTTTHGKSAPPPAPTGAHVGSTVAVSSGNDKANVTLNQVIDPATGSDQFTNPDAGKRFVGVGVTIVNTGSSTINDDANSTVSVQGSDNQTYTADFSGISGCTNFNSGSYTLAPGASVTGCVTFQVPTGVSVSKVQFQPTGFSGGVTGEWKVP
jgi:hypothetical protein